MNGSALPRAIGAGFSGVYQLHCLRDRLGRHCGVRVVCRRVGLCRLWRSRAPSADRGVRGLQPLEHELERRHRKPGALQEFVDIVVTGLRRDGCEGQDPINEVRWFWDNWSTHCWWGRTMRSARKSRKPLSGFRSRMLFAVAARCQQLRPDPEIAGPVNRESHAAKRSF